MENNIYQSLFPAEPKQYLEAIEKMDSWGFTIANNWSNHRPMLYLALNLTHANVMPVLELGVGHGSTPLLHDYCEQHSRNLISFDTNEEWLQTFKQYASACHKLYYSSDNNDTEQYITFLTLATFPNTKGVSVCLVDHACGERRHTDMLAIKDNVSIFVAHDTEPAADSGYQFSKVWPHFKYVLHLKTEGAWATICSDEYDVTVFSGLTFGGFKLEV